MMAMAFEQESTLPGRAGGIEAGNRLVTLAKHAMFAIDCEPAFRMHEHRAQRPKRDVRPLAELRTVAGVLIVFAHAICKRGCRD